jgi:aspartate carbamoyltransferase catalytic subunit
MFMKHCICAQQWNRNQLDTLFQKATYIKENPSLSKSNLSGRIMATLFYEPSTRTRLSFETAMLRSGGSVISTENASQFSSAIKGETLEDTIRVISGYADVIVLRHPESGSAQKASSVSSVPLINAGDGSGQHPTQALLDLFTIHDELHCIDGITIAMVGDLLYGRTVHSLCYLLAKNYTIKKLFLVAPETVRMREDILTFLKKKKIPLEETPNLSKILPQCDVVYQTRIQKERFGDKIQEYEKAKGIYTIGKEEIHQMKKDAILLHPLPRIDEIDTAIDNDPRSAYFRQAKNGLFVRMALLETLLKK